MTPRIRMNITSGFESNTNRNEESDMIARGRVYMKFRWYTSSKTITKLNPTSF